MTMSISSTFDKDNRIPDDAFVKERQHPIEKTLNAGKKQKKNKGLQEGWTRASFIIRQDVLDKFYDFAYTERLTKKDAITQIFDEYFKKYEENGKKLMTDPGRKK